MLGLDRKKMEESRLARLATKRKRNSSPSPPGKLGMGSSSSETENPPAAAYLPLQIPPKTQDSMVSAATSTVCDGTHATINNSEPPQIAISNGKTAVSTLGSKFSSHLQYPQGAIKRTWSANHPRHNDIKIEEVLLKDQLKTAVFSSFLWETEWLFTKVDPSKTRIIFIMEVQAAELGVKMCIAKLGTFSKMHSKLMLLFYNDFLRIVIPTANLMHYDWGETGFMENMVFLIDLPRRADGKAGSKENLTFFGRELLFFLEQLDLWDKARDGILNFDFSQTENMAFIHSVAGTHFGQDMRRTGYIGLGGAIRQLGLTSSNLKLDFASASIGSLDLKTISSFYHSCCGVLANDLSKQSSAPFQDRFRVYFPAFDTIRDSMGGFSNAGTICLQRKWWERNDFPRSMFADYQSTREGMLSHNKILFARGSKKGALDEHVSWVYVGSANLSSSAWGKITHDRQKKENKLTCANWECGVVVIADSTGAPEGLSEGLLRSAFKSVLDVPFKEPARPYTSSMEPWYFLEHVDD